MKYTTLLFAAFLFSFNVSFAQEEKNIDQIIESLLEHFVDDESLNKEQLIIDLYHYAENPININYTSAEELRKLHLLSEFQISQLQSYIQQYGNLLSIHELQVIKGFTDADKQRLAPFLTFQQEFNITTTPTKNELISRISSTLQTPNGYKKGVYQGSKLKKYFRIKAFPKSNIQVGVTAETDAGEPFFKSRNKYGFDFYSGYFSFRPKRIINEVIVGDYRMQHGMGLAIWYGYKNSKGAQTTQITTPATGLSPYSSTDENRFLRGVASYGKIKSWRWNLFYSNHKIDGNKENQTVTSHPNSGLHRTENELDKKHQQTEQITGATVSYQRNTFQIGIGYFLQKYKLPLIPQQRPDNLFRFTGKSNSNISLNYTWHLNFLSLMGEIAQSKSKGLAIAQSANVLLSDQLKMTLHYRNIARDFHSIAGTTFSQSSSPINENGFYSGIEFLPWENWQVNAYMDSYQFNWLKYNEISPTDGYDWFLQIKRQLNRLNSIYLRIKHSSNRRSLTDAPIKQLSNIKSSSYRLQYKHTFNDRLSSTSRAEVKQLISPEKETGWLLAQTFKWQASPKLKLYGRVAYFNTPSYASRIYIYENDALYNFSTPAFWDKGVRLYILTQLKLKKSLSIWLKLSDTYKLNQEQMGSGNNQIQASHLTEFKLQLRYRF
ncbi:hypothetical protein EMN47_15585 [Prolixibacteraceae bacterium JC049]|nr:hypothetical protein [Prolixibacteraceae bacterium JC049]